LTYPFLNAIRVVIVCFDKREKMDKSQHLTTGIKY